VLKIYEVWHYDKFEKYDTDENPNGGLFSGYGNSFMKIKLVSIVKRNTTKSSTVFFCRKLRDGQAGLIQIKNVENTLRNLKKTKTFFLITIKFRKTLAKEHLLN